MAKKMSTTKDVYKRQDRYRKIRDGDLLRLLRRRNK